MLVRYDVPVYYGEQFIGDATVQVPEGGILAGSGLKFRITDVDLQLNIDRVEVKRWGNRITRVNLIPTGGEHVTVERQG